MEKFVDRQAEIAELNRLLALPGAQLILVYGRAVTYHYGRRRVGKTTLLLHWARQAGRPYLYWVARRETADASRHSFARAVWAWAYPEIQNPEPPRFDSWELLFREMARMFAGKPLMVA